MKFFTKNIVCSILIGIAFLSGFYLNDYLVKSESLTLQAAFEGMDLGLMKRVLDLTTDKYVDADKIDRQKITYGAISGMINAIGDPYTVFFNPDDTKSFFDDMAGKFSGIGVQIDEKDGEIKVVAPIKGTPADRAGILAGDTIFEVDKNPVAGITIDKVVSMIKGAKGTKVTIGILRGKNNQVKTFEIIRDEIVMPSIDLSIKEIDQEKRVGVLTIYHFSNSSAQDFNKIANEMLAQKVDGIVLDLRNNPGGLLDQADSIAGWFLKTEEIILVETDKYGEKRVHKSEGPALLENIPTVILVNEGTASAAEILAGALRDDRKIDIIGKQTFGKGVVQEVIDLDDGSSLKVTVSKWFTPSGELIQDTGIKPTIEVELTKEDYDNGNDTQLKKALEQLAKKII